MPNQYRTLVLSEEEREHLAYHLLAPSYASKANAEMARRIMQLLGYEAELQEAEVQFDPEVIEWEVTAPELECESYA